MNSKIPAHLPELGLVCITANSTIRFRTVTRKRLLSLSISEQEQLLQALYTDNINRLNAAITFCVSEGIRLYRINSTLFPFSDDPVGEGVLTQLAPMLETVGRYALTSGIRLVSHPPQFVVLNSDRPQVVENSIKILAAQAMIFDLLGLPQSPWSLMNIHGGKGDRAKPLVSVIRSLPDAIRLRLTLENDEYTYSAATLIEICRAAEIPMVFDAHHHVIHEHLDTYEDPSVAEMLAQARTTWAIPQWQLVHISNGEQFFNDPRHSDFITVMPSSYRYAPWIEVEAKQKELAIAKLRQDWLPSLSTFEPVA
ncbi:UV DNA damage repair endonuclease UvsE [Gloeothece verrucosa]|uniref:UV-endonuclease UvdE n=1 Tax=Gloeothece verrucosa (strain PCC 7822) TaxID=497965 RepID=E0UH99_GLOV7|nr:UV DNA damage repair endonuclease UvsE [Gloeothece verrucosa]ADN16813.1 UV-endonuclease UvdE [Gloeothece verrucosa PCC 7822]